jgi:putative endonuclease
MGAYILKCSDGTLYTGATKDVIRRLEEHNSWTAGAKYTKMRRPVSLVYFESATTWSEACKREHAIKKLSRSEKIQLLSITSIWFDR